MDRFKEIYKTLAEVLAVLGGGYQLVRYSLVGNVLYWVFISLWAAYLCYEAYVKVGFLKFSPAYPDTELRLTHMYERAFMYFNRFAAMLVLGFFFWLLLYKRSTIEGEEWVFVVLCLLFVLYASIHIPTIWLEVDNGYLKGSQLSEKILVAEIQKVVIDNKQIMLIYKHERAWVIRYLQMGTDEKGHSYEFFSSLLSDSSQVIVMP